MKKYNSIIYIMVIMLTITACQKSDPEDLDGFNVTTEKSSYLVGEEVTFNFNDVNVDQITFYSGEGNANYKNLNRLKELGINKLQFETSMQQGLLSDNDSLRLLISTNLSGYDSVSVVKATWVDITSRNTQWPTTLNTTFIKSDLIDVSDFNTADKINIAFRALGKKKTLQAQRKWQVRNLELSNELVDGSKTFLFSAPFVSATTPSASIFQYTGWVQVSLKNSLTQGSNVWDVGEAGVNGKDSLRNKNGISIKTAYPLQFNPGVNLNNDDNDDWVITTAVDLKSTRSSSGIIIKNAITKSLKQHVYKFTKAGNYQVTFVAINDIGGNGNKVVKTINLEIK